MFNFNQLKSMVRCIDDYLTRTGKKEINEMEANTVLARVGLLDDDYSKPGRPLRELLANLRDANLLPNNIRQLYGRWVIGNSRCEQQSLMIVQYW